MLWLYLRLPRLQLDTQRPNTPMPVAVVDDKHRLCQVNRPARRAGIEPGMGLATAASLCPSVELLPYRHEIEERRLEELAQLLYDLCGDLSLDTPCGAWLGATRMLRYHNGFNNYCKNIEACLNDLDLVWHLGAGHTPQLARLLSRAPDAPLTPERDKLLQYARRCPLTLCDLPDQQRAALSRLGIRRLGELLDMPLKELSRRFEPALITYLLQLSGRRPQPLPFYQPPARFQAYRELPHELSQSSALMPWIERLLKELEQFLLAGQRRVTRLRLGLHFRENEPRIRTIGAARGEYRAERWTPLVALTLERELLAEPVVALSLTAEPAPARENDARSLFHRDTGSALGREQLLAMLQARLGPDRVCRMAITSDHRPLVASRECPVEHVEENSEEEDGTPSLRPSLLLESPLPCRQPLELRQGPERITAGWWDGRPEVRDYFVARAPDGRWCWVFRHPGRAGWFLQGYFA